MAVGFVGLDALSGLCLDGLDVPDVLRVLRDGAVGGELGHVRHRQNRLLRPRRLVLVQLICRLDLEKNNPRRSQPVSRRGLRDGRFAAE